METPLDDDDMMDDDLDLTDEELAEGDLGDEGDDLGLDDGTDDGLDGESLDNE